MTMERWRWMPHDLGERYILVNVPAYQLQVVEHERPVLGMRVVVGSPDNPTPLFSDLMTYIVFSPYWNIPDKIIREETLPRVVKDPDFLNRTGIEVVRAYGRSEEPVDPATIDWSQPEAMEGLRFRQVPGPENALGLVKFIFPNHFSVYLHDTPADALFKRDARALSHGCVRIEQPITLAEYVLRDQQDWTREKIDAAMHSGEERIVKLKAPIPVHLGYWTAWVTGDRSVAFTDDPYRLDARHAQARRTRDQQALR
jgi:murein L,D-transpeptidase YcbB/YkuD